MYSICCCSNKRIEWGLFTCYIYIWWSQRKLLFFDSRFDRALFSLIELLLYTFRNETHDLANLDLTILGSSHWTGQWLMFFKPAITDFCGHLEAAETSYEHNISSPFKFFKSKLVEQWTVACLTFHQLFWTKNIDQKGTWYSFIYLFSHNQSNFKVKGFYIVKIHSVNTL